MRPDLIRFVAAVNRAIGLRRFERAGQLDKNSTNMNIAGTEAGNREEKQAPKAAPGSAKKVTMPKIRAFSAHLLTASGSFLAFLSLVAMSEKHWTAAWAWLGVALFVDGIDGPIARRLDVKYVLPSWSGELLDHVIDYVTYVILPAFALYQASLMGEGLSFVSAALIVITSAIYYADTGMKTEENFFKGFPVVWNIVVFTLFAVHPPAWLAFAFVLMSAVLSFMPVYFVHPVRVKRLRRITAIFFALWGATATLTILYYHMEAPDWLRAILIVSGLYLYFIGAVLQIFPRLGRGAAAKAG